MTTKRQIENLMRPLIARHRDLVLDSPWLYLKPVPHLLRAILIDRTGEASRFRVRWTTTILFAPVDTIDLAYGEMHTAHERGLWLWNDPDMPSILFDLLEREALPALRGINGIDAFVAYASSQDRFPLNPLPAFPHRQVLVDVARGEWASARAICEKWAAIAPRWPDDQRSVLINTLAPMLRDGNIGDIISQLHAWEQYTVKQLKLENIWERTPFPVEAMAH